jgi:hypothetical protein
VLLFQSCPPMVGQPSSWPMAGESSGKSTWASGHSCFGIGSLRRGSCYDRTEKNIVTTQPSKAPSPKTDFVAVTAEDLELSDLLAVLQVQQSVQVPSGASEQMYSLTRGAIARYRDFAPADATERHLVTLCVGLENAAMVSLRHAAGTDVLPVRTEELKNAMSATHAVTKLLDTLERRRGRGKQSIMVGQVTVETGGQAIVGNVNSESRRSTKSKEMEDPNSNPSRQEEK